MNTLTKKTLEENHFSDGGFQTLVSSFDPKKNFRMTQSTFGSPSNKSLMKFNPRLIALGDASTMMQTQKMGGRSGSQRDGVTLNSLLKNNGTLN